MEHGRGFLMNFCCYRSCSLVVHIIISTVVVVGWFGDELWSDWLDVIYNLVGWITDKKGHISGDAFLLAADRSLHLLIMI